MKKLLYACLLVMLLVSCEDHEPCLRWNFVDIQVYKADWQISADSAFYSASVNVPEITLKAFQAGLVKCYRDYNYGSQTPSRQELPCVFAKEENIGGNIFRYTEILDYEYAVGSITLFYTVSDFDYNASKPDDMHFRLVIQR